MNNHHVYAVTGQISINGKFEERVWLAFYQGNSGETDKRKLLGTAEVTFPIKYPLKLDNGIVIQEEDYYRKYSEE